MWNVQNQNGHFTIIAYIRYSNVRCGHFVHHSYHYIGTIAIALAESMLNTR